MSNIAVCPECKGHRMIDHPSLFQFSHTFTCTLRDREDSRKFADVDAAQWNGRVLKWKQRDVTPTELLLLAACGIDPDDVACVEVRPDVTGVVQRRFLRVDGSRIAIPGDSAQ